MTPEAMQQLICELTEQNRKLRENHTKLLLVTNQLMQRVSHLETLQLLNCEHGIEKFSRKVR